jgi:hypothetical protein
MEAIDHRLTVGQKFATRLQVRGPHVGMVEAHRLALLGRQPLQTRLARRLVPPLGDGEDLRARGVGQIGQDRGIAFVALPQADLIHPQPFDLPLGIDLLGLGVVDPVLHDAFDGLGRDPQPLGHILGRAADQADQHVLLEAIAVFHVAAFEGR